MTKLIIISGANSGIGLECVRQFLDLSDTKIMAISRSTNNLVNVNHDNLIIQKCDVTDFNEVQEVFNNITQGSQQVVGLINNAGVAYGGDFSDMTHSDNQLMVDVNVKGATNLLELVVPHMRDYGIGTIINLSSLADRYPRPNLSVYAATKAYIKSLSDSLRLQNAKYNIRITNIAPALIATPMIENLNIDSQTINVVEFVKIIKNIYLQPQNICIRDLVVAPTMYEG